MSSHSSSDQSTFERERAFIMAERKRVPELFVVSPEAKADLLRHVGITAMPGTLPKGYIRATPLDFIVEEIGLDGQVVEIAVEPVQAPAGEGAGTVHADVVKIFISTLDAAQRLAEHLKLPAESVRYAGIKDAVAVAAQRVSLRGTTLQQVLDLRIPNIHLKNIREGKGALNVGDLNGNRFTLCIRTGPDFDADAFEQRLEGVKKNGVVNFYGIQRFGSPRFLSHYLGLHLLRGDLSGMFKVLFTQESRTEMPYAAALRAKAAPLFGDWKVVREIFETLPYTFRHEITALHVLEAGGPRPYDAAIEAISAQVNLWARAYTSYLTNRILSDWSREADKMPAEIPLLFSHDPSSRIPYLPHLKADGTEEYLRALSRFRFINIGKAPKIPTLIHPTFRGHAIVPNGLAISFELPKAAYATTVLMHLFDVITGWPEPKWLVRDEVDTKLAINLGTIAPVRERFAKELADAAAARSESEEAEA